MIIDQIGLRSLLLPLLIDVRKQYESLAKAESLLAPVKKKTEKKEDKTKIKKETGLTFC